MFEFNNLFSPIKIGRLELKNRGVMPSMVTNFCNADGSVNDRFIAYHEARAKGGVGMIIIEAAYVDSRGKGFNTQVSIDRDELIPGLKKLTDTIHQQGTKIAVQIYHGGRQANTVATCQPLVAPSPIPCPVMQSLPKELTVAEIKEIVQEFADAAERAQKAGFDAVEIHGAHGYLLNQFLSPDSNKRTDEYGGSDESRRRFPLEVVDAVRAKVGKDFPLIYRITTDEFLPEGLTIIDTADFSKDLVKHGIDAINVSGSTYAAGRTSSGSDDILGVYVENAAEVKRSINSAVPVIVANRIKTPAFAESVISEGKADMVATGRALISDADFYAKARDGKAQEIRTCLSCNHCVSELMEGVPISCLHNPLTGHELEYDLSIPAATKQKVLVIGGGPAGMEAAVIAATKGHSVTLVEQNGYLGGNVVPGTKPPFKFELLYAIDYLHVMLTKYNVDIRLHTKADADLIEAEKADTVIIASGSVPMMPPIPGSDPNFVIKAEDVLMGLRSVGDKAVIIGGGSVGIETGEMLVAKGKDVTVVEMLPEVLKDLSATLKAGLLHRVSQTDLQILTSEKVLEIKQNAVVTDNRTIADVDTVIMAVGYKSNNDLVKQLQDRGLDFKVIGDASKPRKIYQAVKEGFEIAYNL
ncbi:MAG: FAD-dependent oxidoreductase [Ruminococcaceae bacterium]|nr:FAD-dependent oxidoreductase [Oscillospiraceae bacterium]